MKKRLAVLLCLFVAAALVGCRSGSPKVVTVPVADVTDGMVKLQRNLSPSGVPVNMDYQHPHQFDEETLRSELNMLVAMEHKWGKYGVGSKWTGKPAFSPADKEKLIPALTAAFETASRSDIIVINAPGRGGRPTRAEVFLKDGKMVWLFHEIDGTPFLGELPYRLDSKDWRIEEKSGMSVRNDERTQTVRVERDLAIEAQVTTDVARETVYEPAPSRAEPVPPRQAPEEAASHSMEQLDKKLETLKEWKDEGLITDEEYAKEKARIIEKLHDL